MNVQPLNEAITPEDALIALRDYNEHRKVHDKLDKEITRIYRAIAKGKKVISVQDAIVRGGIDGRGRPRLAIMRADQQFVRCHMWYSDEVVFTNERRSNAADWHFKIPWPTKDRPGSSRETLRAQLPRIPPQYRPAADKLSDYHILWEADWTAIPRDPYLLKRIGKDAWVVLAAWDLTDVEVSVLRAHQAN